MSASSYDSYKESGVEWLGKVPSHWQIAPFWSLYRRTKRTGFPDVDLLSVYRDYGVIRKSDRDDNFNNPSDDLSTYQLVEPGDLAMNKMKAWQGSLGVSAHRGIVSPAYFVFQAHHAENRQFLHYLLRSRGYAVGFMSISKGIRIGQWDIDPDHLRRVPVPLPSLAEQAAIAAFLDRETSKIDALVEAQTRLIELLKEKRQAVISHAVTKGLDPAAPMKDSGVEWLGQVPAHWEVKRLSYVFRTISSGTTPPSDQAAYYDGDVNWVTTGELRERAILQTAKQVSDTALRTFSALKIYQPGTLLIAMYGATIGRLGWLVAPAATNQACCAFADPVGAETRFVFRYLQAARESIILLASGGGQPNISQEKLRSLPIPLPPMPEQAAIIDALDGQLQNIERLEGEAEAAIALLQERRAALISATVTGKIDVRSLVPVQAEAA